MAVNVTILDSILTWESKLCSFSHLHLRNKVKFTTDTQQAILGSEGRGSLTLGSLDSLLFGGPLR